MLDVDDLDAVGLDEGLDEGADGLVRRSLMGCRASSLAFWAKEKRGLPPTLANHPKSNGTAR